MGKPKQKMARWEKLQKIEKAGGYSLCRVHRRERGSGDAGGSSTIPEPRTSGPGGRTCTLMTSVPHSPSRLERANDAISREQAKFQTERRTVVSPN